MNRSLILVMFIVATMLSVLLSSKHAGAAVTYINSNTVVTTGSTATISSYTVASGTDRLLVVGVSILRDESNRFVNSVTYGGQSLTFSVARTNPDDEVRTEIWYLINPNVGTANVTINLNNSARMVSGVSNYTGVDQTTPISATASFGQNSGAPSLNIASVCGGIVYDVGARDNNGSATPGANQTELWDLDSGSELMGFSSIEDGDASITMSWTTDDNGQQSTLCVIAIAPSSTASEICNNGIDDDCDGNVDCADSDCVPANPGAITVSNDTICSGQIGESYSIVAVPGATSYTWTVPAGATITVGQGTINIAVNWGSTAGNVCVTAYINACPSASASCQAIVLTDIPSDPTVIVH